MVENGLLYCGACGECFSSSLGLQLHMEGCVYAKILKPQIDLMAMVSDCGHVRAGKVALIKKYRHDIDNYVLAATRDVNTLKRAELHLDLCEKLYVSHRTFKPFEATEIIDRPSFSEGIEIFLIAYFKEPWV